MYLPLITACVWVQLAAAVAVGLHAADGDQTVHDALDHACARVPGREEAAALALEIVEDVFGLPHAELVEGSFAVAVETLAARDGDGFEVVEVEGDGEGDGDDNDGVGSWRANDLAW